MEQYRWLPLTKIRIPTTQETLHRDSLIREVIAAISSKRLTLLAAPAGSGKTTLAAMAVKATPAAKVAWLSLDREDNDPTTFLIALISALQTITPTIGQWVLQNLATPAAPPDFRRLMGILLNEITEWGDQPLLVVLDDLHLLTDPTIAEGLNYLLERMPPHLHLLATTRYDPPLALAKVRARGQLAEFRLAQLLFTAEETANLLNDELSLALPAADIAHIHQRSEGWVAGVRLLALSLGQLSPAKRSDFLAQLATREQYVFDLLAEEVLAQQPQEVRDFLLATTILRELTPDLCRKVTQREDAGDLLASLYRRNLFLVAVEGENANRTYRYHALFHDFLRERLEGESPTWIRELHRRAAAATMPAHALYHYVQAEAWEEAAILLGQIGQDALWQGRYGTLREWLGWIPTAHRHRYPWLLFLEAFLLYHDGNMPQAYPLLQEALKQFEANGDQAGEWETIGALIGNMLGVTDEEGATYYLNLCHRLLANPVPAPLRGRVLMGLAWWNTFAGDRATFPHYVEEAMALCRAVNDLKTYGAVIPHLSIPFFSIPDGRAKLTTFYKEFLERFGDNSPLGIWAHLTLMGAAFAMGDWQQRQRERGLVERALPHTHTTFYWNLNWLLMELYFAYAEGNSAAMLANEAQLMELMRVPLGTPFAFIGLTWQAYRAWLTHDEQPLRQVQAEVARLQGEDITQNMSNMGRELIVEAIIALMAREYKKAEMLLQRISANQQPFRKSRYDHLDVRVLWAHLYLAQRRRDEAAVVVKELLSDYEQVGELGSLLRHGDAIAPVLDIADTLPAVRESAAKIRALWSELRAGRTVALPDSDETLTPREVEVLALLCTGASNRAIADQLVVTERTVKSHVTNILSKMGVTSRAQAVARAHTLHLV